MPPARTPPRPPVVLCPNQNTYLARLLHSRGYHIVRVCSDCGCNVLEPGQWVPRDQCPADPDSLPVWKDLRPARQKAQEARETQGDLFDGW